MKKLLGFILIAVLLIWSISFAAVTTDPDITGIGGGGVSEGDDVTFGAGIFSTTLDDATGDEVAVLINYTTNKATSGNDTGLVINQLDTASPGISLLIDAQMGGVSKAWMDNVGYWYTRGIRSVSNTTEIDMQASSTSSDHRFRISGSGSGFGAYAFATHGDTVQDKSEWWLYHASVGMSNTAGHFNMMTIQPWYNQTSGTASNTDFLINRTETAVGSGDQLLIDAQVDDVSMFSIDNNGSSATGGAVAFSGISTATVDYTIGNFEDDPTFFIECDATLGNISTTLPPVADKKGRLLEVNLVSAANGCYLDGNGAETISGETGKAITIQYNSVSLIAGSTQWLIY